MDNLSLGENYKIDFDFTQNKTLWNTVLLQRVHTCTPYASVVLADKMIWFANLEHKEKGVDNYKT